MSRSYKKTPWCTDGHVKTTKENKRIANKKVRKYHKKIHNGKAYKKLSCSYDIHDFKTRWTWKEAKTEYYTNKELWQYYHPTLKDFYRYWIKHYKNK